MTKYLSQNDLEKIYRKEIKNIGKKGIVEKVSKKRLTDNILPHSHQMFLSHSHIDKTIVSKISLLFDRLNTELYIDWLDKSLPEETNLKTAKTIKIKIEKSKKFLFLATYHGLRSKWCNWELGMADVLLTDENLAILPIQSKSGNWKGNEYLQLYPEMILEMDEIENLNENNIFIRKPSSGETISLLNWLNK